MNTELIPSGDAGLPTPGPAAPTDAALVQLWLHGRPPTTVRAYLTAVDDFTRAVGGKPLRAVTLADLQSYADSLTGRKSSTQGARLAALKSLFTFAVKLGYLPLDPARALRLPKRTDALAERIMDAGAVAKVIDAATDPRHRLFLRLAYASGGRLSELVRLRWEECHAHGEAGVVTFARGKGGKTRTVRLPAPVWRDLESLRPGDGRGYVFASERRQDRPIDPATAWRWFVAAAERAKVKASPHWFRHAHASHALDGGAPVHLVQSTLGHASLATTSRYAHARPGESSGDYLGLGGESSTRGRRRRAPR
jgi:integrase/recombinase XerD